MKGYERELKDEEQKSLRRKEKAEKKELMRMSKSFLEENSKDWKDAEETRNIKKEKLRVKEIQT